MYFPLFLVDRLARNPTNLPIHTYRQTGRANSDLETKQFSKKNKKAAKVRWTSAVSHQKTTA